MKDKYKFFNHRECEFFPCHKVEKPEEFNCLFCYCPLYTLGKNCGGTYHYMDNGIKDCSRCVMPHKKESYEYISNKFKEICQAMAEFENKEK